MYGLEHLALRFLLEDYLCITVPDGECILDFRFPPIGVKKLLIYVFILFISFISHLFFGGYCCSNPLVYLQLALNLFFWVCV